MEVLRNEQNKILSVFGILQIWTPDGIVAGHIFDPGWLDLSNVAAYGDMASVFHCQSIS